MPASKKAKDPSSTKPFNVKLMTPREIVGGKEPKKPMPKTSGAKPGVKTPMPKVGPKPTKTATPKPKTTKKKEKMTPQDAAMKKILEKKYGKIYG